MDTTMNYLPIIDLPSYKCTSRAQIFPLARSASGRFFVFRGKSERENEGPTTGTGNEKRRSLRKSTPITAALRGCFVVVVVDAVIVLLLFFFISGMQKRKENRKTILRVK